LSEAFNIPLPVLRQQMSRQRWAALREQLPLATTSLAAVPNVIDGQRNPFSTTLAVLPLDKPIPGQLPALMQKKLEALAANREINYRQADRLRKELDRILDRLEAGTLTIEQVFCNKGLVLREERNLNLQDMVALATYAKMVQDMGYKALGDTAASDRPTQDGPAGQSAPPPITLILPGAISEPREKRALKAALRAQGHRVVDVESEVQALKDPQPVAVAFTAPSAENITLEPPTVASADASECPVCGFIGGDHDSECPARSTA
jgi:hypothetical protein